jgi:hypothetical protein
LAETAASLKSDGDAPLTIQAYRKLFDTARADMEEGRKDSELSRDFYDGDQLTQKERSVLRSRGQPDIVINRIQKAIDGIMGVVESSKTDPRALMRNPPDDDQQNPQPVGTVPQPPTPPQGSQPPAAAPTQAPPRRKKLDGGDVATMVLRYVDDTNSFNDGTSMDVLECGLVEGDGAAVIEIDERKDVKITEIRWEEFFFDPKSRRFDFKDARYLGIAKWMYADDVAALYPGAKDELGRFQEDGNVTALGGDDTWEDRPESKTPWVDSKLRRLMVVDMYHLYGGQWYRCVFYAGGILESAPSAYQDDDGQPCCPIEGWSCYINRKNERYGVVKAMRDPQREVNMRRSKAVHEINVRQVQLVDMAYAGVFNPEEARKEAAKPDGVLPIGTQVVPRNDMVANNLEMLAEAKSEIERMGAAPAVLARQGADASGRAQQIRVQTGLQELARVLNRHKGWKRRVYTQAWWRAKQFWDGPKWIRVTSDNDAPQYIQVNEIVAPQGGVNPQTGRPFFNAPPQIKNHIAKMDADIVLDETPDTATLEQEIFSEFVELAKAYGPQAVPLPILLEMSSIAKKREIINKFEDLQAAQAPQQQMEMQAQLQHMALEMEELKSIVAKNNAQAALTEVQTVTTALDGHLKASAAAALPPGVHLGGPSTGTPVPLQPPPPGVTGANGQRTSGPPP